MGFLALCMARRHAAARSSGLKHSAQVLRSVPAARARTQMPHSSSTASWAVAQPAKPRKKRMPALSPRVRRATSSRSPPSQTPGATSRAPRTPSPRPWSHRRLSFKELPTMIGPPRKSRQSKMSRRFSSSTHRLSSGLCHLSSICPKLAPVGLLSTMPVTPPSSVPSRSKTAWSKTDSEMQESGCVIRKSPAEALAVLPGGKHSSSGNDPKVPSGGASANADPAPTSSATACAAARRFRSAVASPR
mmetsp:Transcript_37358/g.101112  ORF Transcript_37358/g.101112 Transcript_37358/m.101112 type:complete len:246 (-) Transcript_37358:325-1062(-)